VVLALALLGVEWGVWVWAGVRHAEERNALVSQLLHIYPFPFEEAASDVGRWDKALARLRGLFPTKHYGYGWRSPKGTWEGRLPVSVLSSLQQGILEAEDAWVEGRYLLVVRRGETPAEGNGPYVFTVERFTAIDFLHGTWGYAAAGSGLSVLFAFLLTWILAARHRAHWQALTTYAENVLKDPTRASDSVAVEEEEAAMLARRLRQIRERAEAQWQEVRHQGELREAILSSMSEGVLAVDATGRCLALNEAGARLLGTTVSQVLHRDIAQVIRNSALVRFVEECIRDPEPREAEIEHHAAQERVLQVRGARLHGVDGTGLGAVVVLNDITRLRGLERVRKDFVANVSHELRTPITAIKGFVETLLEGGLDDPEETRHFLTIVHRHAERLQNLVEDLLSLARLEEAPEQGLEFGPIDLTQVVREAVECCAAAAGSKDIRIQVQMPESAECEGNAPLLEQAVVNLLDNAIKYSEMGGVVRVFVKEAGEGYSIEVQDFGCGIGAEHLPRIFERFYRVDAARSKKMGGTGLGLAIVKHIVQLHQGSVEVESRLGRGSTFTLRVPFHLQRVGK
jgi:two-component system phosphate regulon sensor histidine kinase PhoR